MILVIFLGVILGVIVFLGLIYLILKNKIKELLGKFGYSDISTLKEEIKQGEIDAKTNHKHVTGMTKLLIPKIVNDFPNFSESEFYNKVETSLTLIFSSLEEKTLKTNDELILIKDKLKEQIKDLSEAHISVKYDDIKFHESALKYYKNKDGVLNITVSTSVEYYYEKRIDNKIVEEYKDYKKQTRYTTEFIYIYNPDKVVKTQSLIGINCPNCGAPLKDLGHKVCKYCGSGLEDINLKSWHISLYKEDY